MKTTNALPLPAICLLLLTFVINVGLTTPAGAQGADPFGGDIDDLFGAPADDDPFGGGDSSADDDPFGEPTPKPEKDKETAKSDETKKTAEDDEPEPPPPIDPALMRIFLNNGNILTGKLSTNEFIVTTAFGELSIPVTRVNSLTPGLRTHADVYRNLQQLIDELGVDDFRAREEAQKTLAKWGLPVRGVLLPYRDDANAERARRADPRVGVRLLDEHHLQRRAGKLGERHRAVGGGDRGVRTVGGQQDLVEHGHLLAGSHWTKPQCGTFRASRIGRHGALASPCGWRARYRRSR